MIIFQYKQLIIFLLVSTFLKIIFNAKNMKLEISLK